MRAKGDTGEEEAEVRIDDEVVGRFSPGTAWAYYYFDVPADTPADAIQVAFVNNSLRFTPDGRRWDRNLWVDHIELQGERYESEAETTFSTGTWSWANGCGPGHKQLEVLHCDGSFHYQSDDPAGPPAPAASPTSLVIRAKGDMGSEQVEIRIGSTVFASFGVTTSWANYNYELPGGTTLADFEVAFVNDIGRSTIDGRLRDRNLGVDYVDFGGVRYESESELTLSTGSWSRSSLCAPGNKRTQVLHCNGSFRYG